MDLLVNGNNATVSLDPSNRLQFCDEAKLVILRGIWRGESPLPSSLPLFVLQLCVINICTRLLLLALKPLRQPHFVAHILAGILMGPSVLGKISVAPELDGVKMLFPLRSVMVLETIANAGLLFHMFFVGLQMELSMMRSAGKKALSIAVAGILVALLVGAASYQVVGFKKTGSPWGPLIWGSALSITSFTGLTRLLADNKVLQTDIGRMTFSSALVSDIGSWMIVAMALAISGERGANPSWPLLSFTALVVLGVYVVRPTIKWLISNVNVPQGDSTNSFSEVHTGLVLLAVLGCGVISNAMGLCSLTGGFLFGLVMPKGELAMVVSDKYEDFVSEILMPLYFAVTGIRINFGILADSQGNLALLLVFIGALCVAKIVGIILVAFFQRMTLKEGTALGLLMNTKGVLAIAILNIAHDKQILSQEALVAMVVPLLIMTSLAYPGLYAIYNRDNFYKQYKRRTIRDASSYSEFRMIACIHEMRHVSGIVNLLEASNGTRRSPITVFALHLVELLGRSSNMLIVHTTRKSGAHNSSHAMAPSDQIIDALENFEQRSSAEIRLQPLTAMSPYSTMDQDICNLAVDKRAALIIVPFHKTTTIEGKLQETNAAVRSLNKSLLDSSPCSVAVLVDRGLGSMPLTELGKERFRIAMIYVGGRDDREALFYAWRMAGRPNATLHVIRFVPGERGHVAENAEFLDYEAEKRIDDEYTAHFRLRAAYDESITYREIVSKTSEETVAILTKMKHNYDLYVVGRGEGQSTPFTAGLLDWSDCPELGAIGDLLVTSGFATSVSVLVVQQYTLATTDATPQQTDHFSGYEQINQRVGR